MSHVPQHTEGEHFGPYRLELRLGRGAAAEVWLAREQGQMGFTKRQALKLLQPPPRELEIQKRALINEARVCGRLNHPGIVDVYKVGDHDGELFIAMEFVDGPDLNSLFTELRARHIAVPMAIAVELAVELAEALDHAHTLCDDAGKPLNIVHRDLKPSNILVDRHGGLKISDWGLVKSRINLDSTTKGVVKGTPGYIAPEVWGGTRTFAPAVDLFALGAILYEATLGERLFSGINIARIADLVSNRSPEEEAERLKDLCPALVPILTKLLQRNPKRRYHRAAEVADELRGIRDALPDRGSFRDFLREVAHVIDDLCPEIHSSYRAEAPEEDEEDEEARRSTSDLSDLNLGGGEGGDDDLLFGGVAGPLRDPSTCEGLTAHKPKEPPSDGLQATVADGTAQAHTNTAEGPALRRGKDDAPTMEAPAVETARGKEAGEVDAGDDVSPVPEASPKPIDPVATVQQTAIKRKRGGGAGKRRRRRRRRLGGPGGDGEPGKGLGRVPPPTAAVVVALCGGALLLAGILAFVMSA